MTMMPKTEGKKRLLVATCIYGVDPIPYASHLNMFYKLGKDLPNWDVIFSGPWRMPIDVARNRAAKVALEEECDYLFFYDDDMVTHPAVVERLLKHVEREEIHIISAKVFIRGRPFNTMIFRFDDPDKLGLFEPKPEDIDENGLVKCGAVGCASTLIDTQLFKMTPEPWFLTGAHNTEDVYFCMKAADHISGIEIRMDMNTECGHMLDKPILSTASKSVLTKIQDQGLDAIWQPNFSGKEVIATFKDDDFESDDFDVTPSN